MKKYLLAATALAVLGAPAAALACSACGCNLDTDEAPTASATPPGGVWSLDERVDYVNQNSLWLGGHKASPQDPTLVEVQHNTTTIYYTTTLDYQSSGAWGANLAVPAQYRTHSTSNDGQDWTLSKSQWNELGDIRALGRYAVTASHSFGLLAGAKLPTGTNKDTFNRGPASGTLVDPGLQPGTGTWDSLLGLSENGQFTDKLGWFAQELWQKPLTKHDQFAEGQKVNASLGLRYSISEIFTAQIQLNGQNRTRDHGANADIANSGGDVLYASPGLFINVTPGTALYGFIQLPVYQRVGGLELVPDYSASVGIKHKF